MKLIYGVGFNDRKYPARIGKDKTLEYSHWQKMLMRCYKSNKTTNPSYMKCTVSDNFKNYSYFYEWCQNQFGFGLDGYHLDKDILVKNNNIYSEDTCVFIPQQINNIFLSSKSRRGEYPVGVSFSKHYGKFECHVMRESKRTNLGLYKNPNDAFMVYKKNKEDYVKYMANKHKDKIDHRVYEALMNREICIDD